MVLKASMPEEFDRAELDAFIESTKPHTEDEASDGETDEHDD